MFWWYLRALATRELQQCLRRNFQVSLWFPWKTLEDHYKHLYQLAKDRWRREAQIFLFHRFKSSLSICHSTLDINRHHILLIGTYSYYFNNPHTSPEKACPLRRCSDPWLSSLPKCSRISSSRWLYVIGPPDMLTKCSLSRRKDTCLPVLYMVPLTCKTMGNRSKKALLPFLSFSLNSAWCLDQSLLFLLDSKTLS